jgi:Cu-Zn family superoxide dismutase
MAQGDKYSTSFIDTKGQTVGTADLTPTAHGVLVSVDMRNLPPGEHAFHLHEKGVCDAADGFKSAGGHYGPAGREHGYFSEHGPHAGDMPNQFVAQDGRLKAQTILALVTFEGGEAPIFDQDGSALVLHAVADDYRSQPAGNAGDRIACAVIKRK